LSKRVCFDVLPRTARAELLRDIATAAIEMLPVRGGGGDAVVLSSIIAGVLGRNEALLRENVSHSRQSTTGSGRHCSAAPAVIARDRDQRLELKCHIVL
jgi:hypothetical protein